MDPSSSLSGQDPLHKAFLANVLGDLVRTESTNPGTYEAAMAHRVVSWLEPTGARIELVESMPGRPSVAAVLAGSGDGPRLVLNGHIDTVPIDDAGLWTSDPFGGAVRNDGYLYGRGACDMKAGLAVQIGVVHHLSRHVAHMGGSLVLHFAAGEERAERGTLSLLEAGYTGDYGIVTEPTELRIAPATRGLAFFRIRLMGRSIHASRSHLGVNPAWGLRWVLDALEAHRIDIERRQHPLLGCGSVTPTVVRGGVAENAVSDVVDLFVDRRLIPGETVADELHDMAARLHAARPADTEVGIEVTVAENAFEPAEIRANASLVGHLIAAVGRVTGAPGEVYGAPFASDVRNLVNDAGIEAVTFGPGNVAECHCADERVATAQLEVAARTIADVAWKLLMDGVDAATVRATGAIATEAG